MYKWFLDWVRIRSIIDQKQKTKSKSGGPKSKVNNTEYQGPENSLLEQVVSDDKVLSVEIGLKNVKKMYKA